MTALTPEQEAFVEEARSVRVETALARAGFSDAGLKRSGGELVGPCPACGGRDRFSISVAKNVFNCRGAEGGDAIALVRHLTGEDFLSACETLTGRDRPGLAKTEAEQRASVEARQAAEERAAKARGEAEAKAARQMRAQERYRDDERARCRRIWADSFRFTLDSDSAAYLRGRGLVVDAIEPAFVHTAPALGFFHQVQGPSTLIHTGPAMLALFVRPDGAGWEVTGLHQTWLDPQGPKGRPVLFGLTKAGMDERRPIWRSGQSAPSDADLAAKFYERLPTKKMRGSKKGGLIPLVGRLGTARRMVAGEGIETVLAFARREGFAAGTFYCAAGDLGNLCGKAVHDSRVRHPFLKKLDARGRERAVMVPGDEPDVTAEAMPVPNWIDELVLLGDGDSEPVMTRLAMKRGARRHARPGRTVRIEMAPAGMDFSDLAEVAA